MGKPSCYPPSPFFCRPEAQAEGSLGTCVPRDDIPGRRPERSEGCLGTTGGGALQGVEISRFARNDRKGCRPVPTFCRPEAQAEGSPLRRRPERSVLWDAVPNEVRDASLSLGMTKNGRSEAQCRGTFLNSPRVF